MFEILPQTSKQTGHYQLEVQKERDHYQKKVNIWYKLHREWGSVKKKKEAEA